MNVCLLSNLPMVYIDQQLVVTLILIQLTDSICTCYVPLYRRMSLCNHHNFLFLKLLLSLFAVVFYFMSSNIKSSEKYLLCRFTFDNDIFSQNQNILSVFQWLLRVSGCKSEHNDWLEFNPGKAIVDGGLVLLCLERLWN